MLGSVLTAAGVATAVSAGYQTMAPTGTWFGHALNHLDRASQQIALTFDDGPNDPHTLRLLDVLARHEVQATFFVIGRFAQKRPDIVREIVSAGHVVGNHTFSHPLLTLKSTARIEEEVINCDRALSDAIGVHSKLFRPPFGGRRPAVFRIIRELGLEPVMWNVTGYDWNAPSAEHIERKVSAKVRGGDIILLHDGSHIGFGADRSHTVTATDRLITRYKAEEYRFVPLGEMADNNAREGLPSVSHSNS
ncbi:MAG: polysaccharide deacetylase family protein [Terriglobales bacterium]